MFFLTFTFFKDSWEKNIRVYKT